MTAIRSLKVVFLRCIVRAILRSLRCSIGVEAVARLMGLGIRPLPAEVERLEAFAFATVPCLRPKPLVPIAEGIRIPTRQAETGRSSPMPVPSGTVGWSATRFP